MSSLRYDVTTNDWVIFAPERSRRPHDNSDNRGSHESQGICPFCPGNEHMTDAEIDAVRSGTAPNTPGWTVRVVPNKFPVLRVENDHHRREERPLCRHMEGCGAHEVIIESPEHDSFLAHDPVGHIEQVLNALHRRFNDLLRDRRFETIVIFKNHGEDAGTSLQHPHWQLIATPVVPRQLRIKHGVATDYFDRTGECLYCVLLEQELAVGECVVAENDHFAAVMPYAAHSAFETWILPKTHQSSFGLADPNQFGALAQILKIVLAKLYVGLDNPAFNLTVNTAPRGDESKAYFLWHMEVTPRLTKPAGFELGSGMSINTVLPEDAAEYLRGVSAE